MENEQQIQKRTDRLKEQADKSFARWLAEPMTRMGISMIPAGEHRDTLQLLLRSAFDAGTQCGQGGFAVELLEVMFKDRRGKE